MNGSNALGDALGILRRRFWLMLAIVVLGCVISLYVALNAPRLYQATAVVQIEDARIPDTLAPGATGFSDASHRLQLLEQRLMVRANLVEMIETYDLFSDLPDMTLNAKVNAFREAARLEQITDSGPGWQPNAVPTGLMITVRLPDPEKAAAVANDLLARTVAQQRSRATSRARDALDFFSAEEDRVGTAITLLEARIAEFKRNNADALPAGVVALRGQLTGLRESELGIAREIIALQGSSARQREEVHSRQIQLLRDQQRLIADRIAVIEAVIDTAPMVERELNAMNRQLGRLQDQYTIITRRKTEAEMTRALEDSQQAERFEVLETALVPEVPVSRSRKALALLGGVASVAVAVLVALGIEIVNPAIRSAAQLERQLGLQAVVTIPKVRTAREVQRRRLAWVAGLVAVIVGIPVLMRGFHERLAAWGVIGPEAAQTLQNLGRRTQ